MAKKKAKKLNVKFKTVNANADTCKGSIGFRIERDMSLDAGAVDELFTNAELQVGMDLQVGAASDLPGQTALPGTEHAAAHLEGVFTCAGATLRHDHYAANLKCNLADVDISQLVEFSGKQGILELVRLGCATVPDEESDED